MGFTSHSGILWRRHHFDWGLSSHSTIFHWDWHVAITGEGLQILTFARHSLPLSSDVLSELWRGTAIYMDPWHSHLLRTFSSGADTTCLYDCRGWDSIIQPSAFETNALTYCATAAVCRLCIKMLSCFDLSSVISLSTVSSRRSIRIVTAGLQASLYFCSK